MGAPQRVFTIASSANGLLNISIQTGWNRKSLLRADLLSSFSMQRGRIKLFNQGVKEEHEMPCVSVSNAVIRGWCPNILLILALAATSSTAVASGADFDDYMKQVGVGGPSPIPAVSLEWDPSTGQYVLKSSSYFKETSVVFPLEAYSDE
ncbi:hypothetical protein [Delftia tsuruhatensis]|uniref:hypothetical protein n=1 Tax=Delftia tsuruhatensis TaxID=180282 RepID=UPI001F22D9F5|nr:hypothetical protein [Delftia tsuruhatensis]